MAWQCSGNTNAELIENLYRSGLITSAKVKEAMIGVDRAHYCLKPRRAYEDSPQSIGHDATISAPHMHANAAESLLPYLKPGNRVLDIGSGSGYLTHVFANLVGKQGKVVGIEHIKPLVDMATENMSKSEEGKSLLENGSVKFVVGDGRLGYQDGEREGWDAIHVGAAAVKIHEQLIEQLRSPGRIFIPVEDNSGNQYIWTIDKDADGNVEKKKLYGVRYVPLTDAPK